MDKELIFKLRFFKIFRYETDNRIGIRLDFGLFWLVFDEIGILAMPKKQKHIGWELWISGGHNSLYFNTLVGRYCDHCLYLLQFNIFKLIDFCFEIFDNREWDYYKNKRTYDIYDYYNNTTLTYPIGVKPYFKRRKQKAKWYLNTQFLKIYNFDFLNNPWGLTVEVAFLPLLVYSKFSFGTDKLEWFNFDINLEKNKTTGLTFTFKLNLFSRFIEFEIGENTVIREANTYFIEDFLMLADFGADPYKGDDYRLGNIVKYAIERKSLAWLYAIFVHKALDPAKFDNEETLLEAAYKYNYNKEVFDYLTKYINFIPNWELVESCKEDLADGLYEKLLEFKDNPIPEVKEEKEKHSFRHPKLLSFQLNGTGKDFVFNIFTYWDRVFHFNIRHDNCVNLESNFQLVLSRNFWIRNYFLAESNLVSHSAAGFLEISLRSQSNAFGALLLPAFSVRLPAFSRPKFRSSPPSKCSPFRGVAQKFSLTPSAYRENFLKHNFDKCFVFRISSDNVFPLSIFVDVLGVFSDFNIGTRTEDVWYNFNKQRVMTYEECILEQEFKKYINTDEKNKRRRKYKEFYNSKFLKIYNGNYLNKPYGRTVEFSLPFNQYLKFTFNRIQYYNYKNKAAFEFSFRDDKNSTGRYAGRKYLRINFILFKHYFKIVLGEKSITRFSVLHSDKSLAKFKGAAVNKLSLNALFQDEIEPYETWIYKKVVDLGIDLSELDFNDLIYHLAFKPYYCKQTLDYMLKVAKDNKIRLIFEKDNKSKTNSEIIDYIKNETGNDFELSQDQLIKYVENQEDICPNLAQ